LLDSLWNSFRTYKMPYNLIWRLFQRFILNYFYLWDHSYNYFICCNLFCYRDILCIIASNYVISLICNEYVYMSYLWSTYCCLHSYCTCYCCHVVNLLLLDVLLIVSCLYHTLYSTYHSLLVYITFIIIYVTTRLFRVSSLSYL